MSRAGHRFPDQVAKALARHRADAQHLLSIDRSREVVAHDDLNPAAPDFGTSHPVARAGIPPLAERLADTAVIVPARNDEASADAPVVAARIVHRRAYRWLLTLTALSALAWVAGRPVDKALTVGASWSVLSEDAAISSPVDGVVRAILVRPDAWVEQGQAVARIERRKSPELSRLEQDWASLKMQEARLRARIDGETALAYPADMADQFPSVDLGPLWQRERARWQDSVAEASELLDPIQESIEAAESELVKTQAETAALQRRLAKVRGRQRDARGLLKKHVVYEDGVYTEQLLQTLKQNRRDINRELAGLAAAEEQIRARLESLQDELSQRRQDLQAGLRRQLAATQAAENDTMARLRALQPAHTLVEQQAVASGVFKPRGQVMAGTAVSNGETIGHLRIPGDRAVVEGRVPDYLSERIGAGQPASVVRDGQPGEPPRIFAGRVVDEARSGRLRVEILVPDPADRQQTALLDGLPVRVEILTDGEPLWRHAWRLLHAEMAR
jgi:multidrug efflux pump subunit AcrA (membrane-fusion protein)